MGNNENTEVKSLKYLRFPGSDIKYELEGKDGRSVLSIDYSDAMGCWIVRYSDGTYAYLNLPNPQNPMDTPIVYCNFEDFEAGYTIVNNKDEDGNVVYFLEVAGKEPYFKLD